MIAVLASLFSAPMGRPDEAERWADAVDRWQYGTPARPDDPSVEAWAALLRALLCRHGVEQMRADADEAVRRFTAESFVTPTPALQQGIARVLCGDLDGGEACLEDAVSAGEQIGSPEHVAVGLCERSLVAMARSQWDPAGVLADQAGTVLRRAGIEESYATPLVSAVRARTAMYRADLPAVHQELTRAQRLRHLLTYALPHFAVQARLELARVHLALADPAGARTLMREVDDLLRRRPGLGTLAGEATAVRAQLSRDRGSGVPGASALTAAELRLLPLLSTHLSFPQIAGELFLSGHRATAEKYGFSAIRRGPTCVTFAAIWHGVFSAIWQGRLMRDGGSLLWRVNIRRCDSQPLGVPAESGLGLVPVGPRTRRMHNALSWLGGRATGQRQPHRPVHRGAQVVGSVVWVVVELPRATPFGRLSW